MISTTKQHVPDNYLLHWLFLMTLIGSGIYYYQNNIATVTQTPIVASPVVAGLDSYLILRLPEVPLQEAATQYTKGKVESWLKALQREHFQPMLLSEVERRLQHHEGLPERTVVLTFDPGYRHTYEVLSPLIAKYQMPAVWMTQPNTQGLVDRRFLSQHALLNMKQSGYWDIGVYRNEGQLLLESAALDFQTVGDGKSVWRSNAGRAALNQGIGITGLNRLNVSSLWTDEELINRLLAEIPIKRTSYLAVRPIQHHQWGVTMTDSTPDLVNFNLHAPPNRHTAELDWMGTRGITNGIFTLKAKNVEGELWLSLRADNAGNAVHIGFSHFGVFVDEEIHHTKQRLGAAEPPERMSPFAATILLENATVTVLINHKIQLKVDSLHRTSVHTQGHVRLTVYDHLNGAAHVDGITLQMTPSES